MLHTTDPLPGCYIIHLYPTLYSSGYPYGFVQEPPAPIRSWGRRHSPGWHEADLSINRSQLAIVHVSYRVVLQYFQVFCTVRPRIKSSGNFESSLYIGLFRAVSLYRRTCSGLEWRHSFGAGDVFFPWFGGHVLPDPFAAVFARRQVRLRSAFLRFQSDPELGSAA